MNDLSPFTPIAASPSPRRTLRTPAGLTAAGLADAGKLAGLEAVAARYAVAITPAMALLRA